MDEAKQKTGWKQNVLREFVKYWLNVLYLAVVFSLFSWYRRLILAHYEIKYLNYGVALIEALVLAKVIMIADVMGLSRGLFRKKPLIYPTLYKSLVFTVFVALFVAVEDTIGGLFKGQGLTGWFLELEGKGKFEFLAHSLMIFFVFIPFFAFKELGKEMGEGKLGQLFFRDKTLPAA
jgi:hypothetical protein